MKKSEKVKGKERAAVKKNPVWYYAIAGAVLCIIVAVVLFFALTPTGAKTGDTVSVLYVGMLENGSVFDSNVNNTPLVFTLGAHMAIPGFEEAVIGMSKDQVKTVNIPADKAYGQYRSDLIFTVNRSMFGPEATPQAGMYYTLSNPADGTASIVKVINVTPDTVTLDQNHLLTGQNLTFTIRLIEISQAK